MADPIRFVLEVGDGDTSGVDKLRQKLKEAEDQANATAGAVQGALNPRRGSGGSGGGAGGGGGAADPDLTRHYFERVNAAAAGAEQRVARLRSKLQSLQQAPNQTQQQSAALKALNLQIERLETRRQATFSTLNASKNITADNFEREMERYKVGYRGVAHGAQAANLALNRYQRAANAPAQAAAVRPASVSTMAQQAAAAFLSANPGNTSGAAMAAAQAAFAATGSSGAALSQARKILAAGGMGPAAVKANAQQIATGLGVPPASGGYLARRLSSLVTGFIGYRALTAIPGMFNNIQTAIQSATTSADQWVARQQLLGANPSLYPGSPVTPYATAQANLSTAQQNLGPGAGDQALRDRTAALQKQADILKDPAAQRAAQNLNNTLGQVGSSLDFGRLGTDLQSFFIKLGTGEDFFKAYGEFRADRDGLANQLNSGATAAQALNTSLSTTADILKGMKSNTMDFGNLLDGIAKQQSSISQQQTLIQQTASLSAMHSAVQSADVRVAQDKMRMLDVHSAAGQQAAIDYPQAVLAATQARNALAVGQGSITAGNQNAVLADAANFASKLMAQPGMTDAKAQPILQAYYAVTGADKLLNTPLTSRPSIVPLVQGPTLPGPNGTAFFGSVNPNVSYGGSIGPRFTSGGSFGAQPSAGSSFWQSFNSMQGIGGRAAGGPVDNGWYMVGENGPEMLHAGGAGHVYAGASGGTAKVRCVDCQREIDLHNLEHSPAHGRAIDKNLGRIARGR